MVSQGHALSRDELIRVLTVYQGTTTANGAADGSTLICSGLIGVNDYITSKTILIMSGNARNETAMATVFNVVTGQITVNPLFNAQIVPGTLFRIINLADGSSLAIILGLVTGTFNLVNAILVLTETGGVLTATGLGTEDDVYICLAPAGEFEPRKVVIDTSDMGVADVAIVRTYYRIKGGGTARYKDEKPFNGVQVSPMKDIELEPNRFGVVVTIEATAGVVFDWEVHYEV